MTRAQKLAKASARPRRRFCPNFTLHEARRIRAAEKQKALVKSLEEMCQEPSPGFIEDKDKLLRDARAVLRYLKTGGR